MDSSSSCCVFNVDEEVVVIRNGWTPKKENENTQSKPTADTQATTDNHINQETTNIRLSPNTWQPGNKWT